MLSSKSLSYGQAVEYLLRIPRFAGKNTVEDTVCYMEILGNPGYERKIIHVAGTNGKGSVCAYLCSVLAEAGSRTGMFTSPHLTDMTERFRIGGIPVEKETFTDAFVTVMDRLDEARAACGKKEYHPSFFELLFLMGMVMFEEADVDYIILETGLGGRLDATNAVPSPILTVITEIGLDHMQYLGDTVGQIAAEKAGILKKGAPVVFCDKREEASAVIRRRAKSLGIPAFPVKAEECSSVKLRNKSIDFSMHSRYYGYIRLTLSTKALYQLENAAVALRCIETLDRGKRITAGQIMEGIRKAVWEGRMEEILPGVYIDGAHNEDGVDAFLKTVEADGCTGSRYLLFSVSADKDYRAMLALLDRKKLFTCTAVAKIAHDRAAETEALKDTATDFGAERYVIYETVPEAFSCLLNMKKEEDCIYIAGSLYLAGEVKTLLGDYQK